MNKKVTIFQDVNNLSSSYGTYAETRTDSNCVSADAVSYDNTTSGLTATNVQSAIDELGANLGGFLIDIEQTEGQQYQFVNIEQVIELTTKYKTGSIIKLRESYSTEEADFYFPFTIYERKDGEENVTSIEVSYQYFGGRYSLYIDFENPLESEITYHDGAGYLFESISQNAYDNLPTKDPNYLYLITD